MRGGMVRGEKDGLMNLLCSEVMPAGLVGDDAEKVQRIRMVGLHGENLAIERLGVRQSSCPMVFDRELEALGNRHNEKVRLNLSLRVNSEEREDNFKPNAWGLTFPGLGTDPVTARDCGTKDLHSQSLALGTGRNEGQIFFRSEHLMGVVNAIQGRHG
jgi:hypothetical protein